MYLHSDDVIHGDLKAVRLFASSLCLPKDTDIIITTAQYTHR